MELVLVALPRVGVKATLDQPISGNSFPGGGGGRLRGIFQLEGRERSDLDPQAKKPPRAEVGGSDPIGCRKRRTTGVATE